MRWIDTLQIAEELCEKFPEIDPVRLNFVDLRQMVLDLAEFDDDPNHSNERILEAIQAAWIKERQ